MPGTRLIKTCRLDPRPRDASDAKSRLAAARIPVDELRARVHELPPVGIELQVVASADLLARTIELLASLGRCGAPAADAPAAAPGARYRLWRPSAFLARVAPALPPGRAIDLGCGGGRDAVFLAAAGWQVAAVDVLPDALDIGRGLAARYLDDASAVRWVQTDLNAGVPEAAPPFDLIVMVRYLDRRLLRAARALLRPGGSIVVETFSTLHRARHGRPTRDAHVLEPGELRALLDGLEIRALEEGWSGDAHLARGWALAQ
jgi:SAM-dependent methyltransferase